MKTFTFNFFLCGLIILAFTSCKKDSDSSNSEGLSGNILKGKLYGWTQGSDKKIVSTSSTANENTGEAIIGSDGSFSISMTAPSVATLDGIVSYFEMPLAISDTTSKCADIFFEIGDNSGTSIGSMEFSNGIAELTKGCAVGDIMYVTKNTTLKGSFSYSYFGITETEIVDLNLKTGWNLITSEVTKYSEDAGAITIENKISNSVPANMNWKLTVGK
ncbi:MAG: hypothetical protein HXX13_11530 [Bacteroidetes bacterium]|nr:hypothetical protein [Bacteroidota bacterium]